MPNSATSLHPLLDDAPLAESGIRKVPFIVTMSELYASTSSPPGHAHPGEALEPGDVYLGVRLLELLRVSAESTTWRVADARGEHLALHVASSASGTAEHEAFVMNAKALINLSQGSTHPGLLKGLAIAPDATALVTPLWGIGTMADLPALGWPVRRLLLFFRALAETVSALHALGIAIGTWGPADVFVDDRLAPVLSRAAPFPPDEDGALIRFASPETQRGDSPEPAADVFVLGRILAFLVEDRAGGASAEAQLGLSRVIALATEPDPSRRYPSIAEMLRDLAEPGLDAESHEIARPLSVKQPPRHRGAHVVSRAAVTPAVARSPDARPWVIATGALAVLPAGLAPWAISCGTSTLAVLGTLSMAAAGCAASGLPTSAKRPRTGRLAFAIAAAAAMHFLDPSGMVDRLATTRRLHSADASVRAAQVLHELDRGNNDFTGLDLRDMPLGGAHLANADFSGADLGGADLSGADLTDARFDNTNLAGANLTEATLNLVDLSSALGVDEAICDEGTVLPGDGRCVDGHPRP